MTSLINFPMKNQRVTVRSDGTRDINADFDCVPESLAACLQYFIGHPFEGGVLKQIVYGYNYQGGTAAAAYVPICAHYGVHLYAVDASVATLISDIHLAIQNNKAVLITEPDPYSSQPGWTHVIVMHSESPGNLTAMDPFIAADVTKRDQEWAQDLAVKEIWIAEKIGGEVMSISLDTPGISQYFKAGVGNSWICSNGFVIRDGMLSFYRTLGGALAGLTQLGLPTGNEVQVDANHPDITEQQFEYGRLRYDPAHVSNPQPGAGSVFTCKAPFIPSVDQATVDRLNALIADLKSRLQAVVKDATV